MIRNFESGFALVKHVKSQTYGDNTHLPEKLRNFAGEQAEKFIHQISKIENSRQLVEKTKEYKKFCDIYYSITKANDIELSEEKRKWFSVCVEFDIQESTKKVYQALHNVTILEILRASTPTQLLESAKKYKESCELILEASKLSKELTSESEKKSYTDHIRSLIEQHTQKIFKHVSEIIKKNINTLVSNIVATSTPTQMLELAKEYRKNCEVYQKAFDEFKKLIPAHELQRFVRCIKIDIQQFDSNVSKQVRQLFDRDLLALTKFKDDIKSEPKMLKLTTNHLLLREKNLLTEAIIMFNLDDSNKYQQIKNKIENNINSSRCHL